MSIHNYADIRGMHLYHGLPAPVRPTLLTTEDFEFRHDFMLEETDEFSRAHKGGDLPAAFDALLDLSVVTLGTAVMMALPWQYGWDAVLRANLAKQRGGSDRHGRFDLLKPPGWTPPDLAAELSAYQRDLEHGYAGFPHDAPLVTRAGLSTD